MKEGGDAVMQELFTQQSYLKRRHFYLLMFIYFFKRKTNGFLSHVEPGRRKLNKQQQKMPYNPDVLLKLIHIIQARN